MLSTVTLVPQVELADHSFVGHTNGSDVAPGDRVAELEAAIAEVSARLGDARVRAAAHDAERAALQAELIDHREAFAALERDYREAVAEIRRAAADEVERILAGARQSVESESAGRPGTGG